MLGYINSTRCFQRHRQGLKLPIPTVQLLSYLETWLCLLWPCFANQVAYLWNQNLLMLLSDPSSALNFKAFLEYASTWNGNNCRHGPQKSCGSPHCHDGRLGANNTCIHQHLYNPVNHTTSWNPLTSPKLCPLHSPGICGYSTHGWPCSRGKVYPAHLSHDPSQTPKVSEWQKVEFYGPGSTAGWWYWPHSVLLGERFAVEDLGQLDAQVFEVAFCSRFRPYSCKIWALLSATLSYPVISSLIPSFMI